MSENEADRSHMKIARALQFQKEKKEKEKALIIGSTHTHLALSERDRIPISPKSLTFSWPGTGSVHVGL